MNKLLTATLTAVLLLPGVSLAVSIRSINSLTATDQFLATTTGATAMHMKIMPSLGSTHTFVWDNTAWNIAQGGTGATSFTPGSISFISGSNTFVQDNSNLFWDAANSALNLGVNGVQSLIARLTVKGAPGQAIANLLSFSGVSKLFVGANGYVGLGTTNPLHALDVAGALYSRLVDNGSNPTIDWNAGNVQKLLLTSNATISFANAQAGGQYTLILNQDSVGGHVVTWPLNVAWPNGVVPTQNTDANGTSMVSFVYDGASYLSSALVSYASSTSTSADIAFDAKSTGILNTNGQSSLIMSHTVTGSNRMLVCGWTHDGGYMPISAKYDGVSMTSLGSQPEVGGGTNSNVGLYYIVAPHVGTHILEFIRNGTLDTLEVQCASYTGVSQSVTPSVLGQGNVASNPGSATVTTTADKAWTVGEIYSDDGLLSSGTNVFVRQLGADVNRGLVDSNSGLTPSGLHTHTWNWANVPSHSAYMIASLTPSL